MKEIKLFDYQEDMKERIEKALRLHRSVMAQMPTGTGKTYLLTAVIDSFVSNNPMEKVWIVAHRRELVSQIDDTVRKFHSYSASNTSSLLSSVKAMSIQWLMRHYDEIEKEPGMIVIDEAHHALAKTYKEMWERFPNAMFLGLTATPCRLNGKGFTDLFDVLVQSWSVPEFISKGKLATYDFVSIKSDGVTQRLIDSLQKRGADGDYQNKEMDMLLNKKPSIERLYRSLEEFGKDRKGIVYAINISHANAIAEFYREHGIAAVAIDSKTPSSLRKELIERFKASSFSSFSEKQSSGLHHDFSKITPSLFTIKEGSTSHPDPLTLRGEGGNRPTRCSEPLRSKDGGPSKVSPDCAGWDRLSIEGDNSAGSATAVTSFASTALVVVQRELKYLGLWKFAGAVMYVLKEALGLPEEKMIVPMDEKRGKLLLAEILNGGNFGKHFSKYGHFTQQGMAKKYFLKIWRNMHFVRYYPAEALSEPIFRTWHFFWRMKNKK